MKGREVAGPTGLEPATSGVTGLRSNQLSYDPEFRPMTVARGRDAEYTDPVKACKRTIAIVVLALAARGATASEGMRILTFVPGVANGRLPVAVDLGASPPPADLLLNGEPVCHVAAARQTCLVELGPAPRVALLELVRRDASGKVVERARRWVNKPSDARAEVLVRSDCTRAAGPCTLRFSWSHENAIAPGELTVTIDGAMAYQGAPRDVAIPFKAGSASRVVGVDLVFLDGERASQTLLIGSSVSSAVEAPLNAVPVLSETPGGRDPAALKTLGGRVVATVEPGEMELLFVVAPSAVAKLQALTAASQKVFSKNASRLDKALEGVNHVVYFSPLGTRAAFSSASRVSDRMFRLHGFDCTPKRDYHDRRLALPCVGEDLLAGDQYRLAATVASATFNRAAVPRRRAVVVVLGDEEPRPDESTYGAAEVRRYLSDILVPLEVWRLGRAAGADWPSGRRLASPDDFARAFESLRAGLDAQRICWIAEDLDPSTFRLSPEDAGLALAGRRGGGTGAAEIEVASSEQAATPVPGGSEAARTRPDKAGRIAASSEVSVVNLDANVTDKNGVPVHGLTLADFELVVGGRPVAISNFSEIATGPSGTAAVSGVIEDAFAPARPPRKIALFIDRLTLGDARRSQRFFRSLDDFVGRTIGPGDEITLLSFDTSLVVRVPFTEDAGAIHRELEKLAKESGRPTSMFTGTENAERLVDEIAQAEAEMAARETRRRPGVAEVPADARLELPKEPDKTVMGEARFLATEEWLRTKRKVAALRSVLAELGGLEGRKVLIFASHRLSRNPGLEYFLSKRLDQQVSVPAEAREFDAHDLLLSLAKAANGYGVTLHGLYPEAGGDFDPTVVERTKPTFTGQISNRRGMDIDANETDGLHLAVDDTGGLVGLGAEGAPGILARMSQDLDSYYSFGFPPPGGGREKKIELRARRPGLVVRTRGTFVERSTEERMSDKVVSNLFGALKSPRFPITARVVGTAPAGEKGLKVTFEVKIPAAAVALLPASGGRHARVSAWLAILDGGDVTTATPVTREFTLPENVPDETAHFTYTGEVVTTSAPALLSIGILDETSKEAGFERLEARAPGKS